MRKSRCDETVRVGLTYKAQGRPENWSALLALLTAT